MNDSRPAVRPETTGDRVQTLGEEIANSVSHGVGFLLAVAAIPVLVVAAVRARAGVAVITGVSVFGTTMVLMYLTSTLYHSLPPNRAKRVLRILDHNAIFLLIAGTYTPFTLGVLYGTWGWTLFGLVWGLALAGIVLKSVSGVKYHGVALLIYLAMGWLILIAAVPLWRSMSPLGIAWLLAGGIFYTGGIAFYRAHHRRYAHFVWHLFVLLGTVCHFIAVLGYGF